MAVHQFPPSLGFSRQEHWSGLPFPSSVRESEKLKWSPSVVSDSSQPHGLQPTRLLHPWDFPGKSTGVHILIQPNVCFTIKHNKRWKFACHLVKSVMEMLGILECFPLSVLASAGQLGFPNGSTSKESTCQWRRHRRCGFDSWVGKILWRRKMATCSSILAWKIWWTEEPGRL